MVHPLFLVDLVLIARVKEDSLLPDVLSGLSGVVGRMVLVARSSRRRDRNSPPGAGYGSSRVLARVIRPETVSSC